MSLEENSIPKKELSCHIEGTARVNKMESDLREALLAVKLESHLVGATSADKMGSRLEGATATEERDNMDCYLEGCPSLDEMESRMAELYSFMTKSVEMFKIMDQDGFIDSFKRMEIKYKSTVLDESVHKGTKLGLLVGVFEKYLQCRLPVADTKEKCELDAIKFIVEAMVSASCYRVEDFTIDDVWKLMITAYTIRLEPSSVMENEMTWFGRIFTLEMFITQVFRKISYFGEFLYFCSAYAIYEDSPLYKMIDMCDLKDIEIVEDIQRNVTPELGISTFIIYRNWISDSFPNSRENMLFWINITEGKQGLGNFHDAYSKSLETIEEFELLNYYFKRFLIFLGSEASSAHRYFELCVLNSDEFLNGLKSKELFMKLPGIHRYLLKIIQFFVDVLLYLYDEISDSICFKELPKFFKSFWNRSNCPMEYIPTYLFEAMQLLDFVFVDQFHNNYTTAYYDICVGISDIIIDRFELPHTREPIIKKYCLFPFFDLNNVE